MVEGNVGLLDNSQNMRVAVSQLVEVYLRDTSVYSIYSNTVYRLKPRPSRLSDDELKADLVPALYTWCI